MANSQLTGAEVESSSLNLSEISTLPLALIFVGIVSIPAFLGGFLLGISISKNLMWTNERHLDRIASAWDEQKSLYLPMRNISEGNGTGRSTIPRFRCEKDEHGFKLLCVVDHVRWTNLGAWDFQLDIDVVEEKGRSSNNDLNIRNLEWFMAVGKSSRTPRIYIPASDVVQSNPPNPKHLPFPPVIRHRRSWGVFSSREGKSLLDLWTNHPACGCTIDATVVVVILQDRHMPHLFESFSPVMDFLTRTDRLDAGSSGEYFSTIIDDHPRILLPIYSQFVEDSPHTARWDSFFVQAVLRMGQLKDYRFDIAYRITDPWTAQGLPSSLCTHPRLEKYVRSNQSPSVSACVRRVAFVGEQSTPSKWKHINGWPSVRSALRFSSAFFRNYRVFARSFHTLDKRSNESVPNTVECSLSDNPAYRVLWIDRPGNRNMKNADALFEAVSQRHSQYRIIRFDPSKQSPEQQALHFAAADFIVAPTGAALANLAFLRPGAGVVILAGFAVHEYFRSIAELMGSPAVSIHERYAMSRPGCELGRWTGWHYFECFNHPSCRRFARDRCPFSGVPIPLFLDAISTVEVGLCSDRIREIRAEDMLFGSLRRAHIIYFDNRT